MGLRRPNAGAGRNGVSRMDWFFDSNLPILIGIFIGGLIAYPFVKRFQAKKDAQKKQMENENESEKK